MQTPWIAVAVLAALAAAGMAALVRTRWLQSRTLEKCIGLSVGLHLVLAVVAAFVGGWLPASWGRRDEGRMTMLVVLADEPSDEQALADAAERIDRSAEPSPGDVAEQAVDAPSDAQAEPPPLVPLATAAAAAPPPDLVPLLDPAAAEAAPARMAEPSAAAAPESAATAAAPAAGVPAVYADRIGERRAAAAAARGGSPDTERAVQAALEWLVRHQSSDGLWNAARHGAGTARPAGGGQQRPEVGAKSDLGVTGLALLAFLGAGNTHREGPYAATVARGMAAVVERQRADGSLAGNAEFFAALYCHGMATIALAECVALSDDDALRPALDRAVRHTLAMQHPHTGGWRYAAGDRGDTSQLGWQVMVLASGRNAGLGGFEQAEAGARGFLQSVSSGAAGGLAAYRPGERASLTMTAEALFCRLLLGLPADHPAATEALDWLARSPPASSGYNIYSWYYATLASFHAGGPQWDAWNARLQAALLPLQHRSGGPLDGSWDPDPVWGGHGGRVFATALAALTLEVYYRYLPLHGRTVRVAVAP